jgi:hypothetical protein
MLVAHKWPEYVHHNEQAERKLMELHVMQLQDVKIKARVRRVFIIIMTLAFSKMKLLRKNIIIKVNFSS